MGEGGQPVSICPSKAALIFPVPSISDHDCKLVHPGIDFLPSTSVADAQDLPDHLHFHDGCFKMKATGRV